MDSNKVHKSNRGQLSIFLGISMIIIMGMLAFVINVGLFVKAKINLQNAVDAAAFSGAATQSRQLTNIAYANWEIRNTYKEWLFKYYALGQIGLFPTNFNNLAGKSPKVSFRLTVPGGLQFNAGSAQGNIAVDAFNTPSICIHNNTSKNICPLYMVPGLPRFKPIGIGGITEIHEAIVNDLVAKKAEDCSNRSVINYLAAITWTYGSGTKDIPGSPMIASNRPGAWPQALELAMRIRNLEMIVNRPPVTGGIDPNSAEALRGQNADIALNERPYKAFMSAYKNLSGGKYKDNHTDELSNNFKLYEIPPTPFQAAGNSTSGFLIPETFSYSGAEGGSALTKHYLDLQVMPVNYALMYSTFTSTKYSYEGVDAEASCGISKTAIPVPGYILGFVKNPQVLTYYAVKGESKFIGLFYPFADRSGVKLMAYAAAKPYGGRIGPRLFDFINNGQSLAPRNDKNRKSVAYISGLKTPDASGGFKVGFPIPFAQDFWAYSGNGNLVIGGVPGSQSGAPLYGIPNMIYDFDDEADLTAQSNTTTSIHEIIQNLNPGPAPTGEDIGLYNRVQFRYLRDSLGAVNPGTNLSSAQVTNALIRSRRATRYEAINYLIPDAKDFDPSIKPNVPNFISEAFPSSSPGPHNIRYQLFAPLFGSSMLYKNANDVESIVVKYLKSTDESVKTYLTALLNVANSILNTKTNVGGGGSGANLLTESAKSIHANAGTANETPPPLINGACAIDVASKFNHFFRAKNEICSLQPISELMTEFIAKANPMFYYADYYITGSDPVDPRDKIRPIDLMSAYYPGKRQGAQNDEFGTVNHPLDVSTGSAYSSRRNFYSTKFVQLAKLLDVQKVTEATRGISDYSANPALKEASASAFPDDIIGKPVLNPIKFDATTGVNNNYFLNF